MGKSAISVRIYGKPSYNKITNFSLIQHPCYCCETHEIHHNNRICSRSLARASERPRALPLRRSMLCLCVPGSKATG